MRPYEGENMGNTGQTEKRALQSFGVRMALVFVILLGFLVSGCGLGMIQGTEIPATTQNKAIYSILQEYRDSVVKANWERLLKLVSPRFHETRGTSNPDDDYGIGELRRMLQTNGFRGIRVLRFSFYVEKMVYPRPGEAKVYLKSWYTFRYPRGKHHPGYDTGPLRHVIELEYLGGGWMIRRGI